MGEKIETTKWGFLIIAFIVFVTAVSWALWPAQKFVERQVLVNSQQYAESRSQEQRLLQAQLAEIDNRIANTTDKDERRNLENQRLAFRAQLEATR